VILAALQLLAFLLVPPCLLGVIARFKARVAGREGPPVLQPWRDLVRLAGKGAVYSRTTTWVFRAGPVVGLAAILAAGLLLPLGAPSATVVFAGDFALLAALLGLARFVTVTAALDTGSSFEGMGAAREVTFSALAEPALFLGFLSLVRSTGSLDLTHLLGDGLAAARAALKVGGVLAVWSAREDRRFEQRLRHGGFTVQVERVRGRLKKGGPRHTIFLGRSPTI